MYNKKTGRLFEFAFAAPFIIANKNNGTINFSKNFGSIFGTLFQISDDILDEMNTFKEIGKTPGKDKKQGKRTLLSILGKDRTIDFCENLVKFFMESNKKYFLKFPELSLLLSYNIEKLKK
jgi:farnesyl diphosphate synthase